MPDRYCDMKTKQRIEKILLVNTPSVDYTTVSREAALSKTYSSYPPFTLAELATGLKTRTAARVEILDLYYRGLTEIAAGGVDGTVFDVILARALEEYRPDLVGVSMLFTRFARNSVMNSAK